MRPVRPVVQDGERRGPGDTGAAPSGPRGDATSEQYAALRAQLLERRIEPGTILNETSLSARSGVSRTGVREALGRLEQDGLLERVTRGYRVRVAGPEDILEIYEVRIALESAAAAGAAVRRTEFDVARLTHLHAESLTTEDQTTWARLNDQFHQTVWLASHNKSLVAMLDQVVTKIRLFDRAPMAEPENLDATRQEHLAIVQAMRSQDVEAARAAMDAHLCRTRNLRVEALARISGEVSAG